MATNKTLLTKKLLERIVHGAAFLGSGGGGKIDSGIKFVEKVLKGHPVYLLSPPLSPEDNALSSCIVCDIGSINEFDPAQDRALEFAFDYMFNYFNDQVAPIRALFPIETGAENTLAPIALAAKKKGMVVVDADGAGRAVPTLPLSTFSALANLKHRSPVAISNGKGDKLLVDGGNQTGYESLLRPIAALKQFGSSASLALWPDKLETLLKGSVQGTITRAMACGELFEGMRKKNKQKVDQALPIVNTLKGKLLAAGKVKPFVSIEVNAFNFATIQIENYLRNETITILTQNESLIAYSDRTNGPIAVAPDSICYLDFNFKPLTNSEIKGNDLVFVIAVKAHKKLRSNIMRKGFDEIINKLGYSGNLRTTHRGFKKLGTLLSSLKPLPKP